MNDMMYTLTAANDSPVVVHLIKKASLSSGEKVKLS